MPVGGLVPVATGDEAADVIVRNAKVYTQDPARPQAGAVALRDGVVRAVGDDAGISP